MTHCTHRDCNRLVYENDKCIFHCEKDKWFFDDQRGNRIWKQPRVQEFWIAIRSDKMKRGDYNFDGYIFPDFEGSLFEDVEEKIVYEGTIYRIHKSKKSSNFWENDQELLFDHEATFQNATFSGRAFFACTTFEDIADFSGAIFQGLTDFKSSSISRGNYKKATFVGESYFDYAFFKNGASFNGAVFRNKAYIENVIFKNKEGDTSFNGTTFQDIASFNGSEFHNEAYFSGTIFQNMAVFYSLKKSDNLHFDFIKLQGESLIDFSNFTLRELKMTTIQNLSSYVRLTNLKITNRIDLRNTNLGKSEFNNIDLSECKEILIRNSSFYGTIFNNVIWGRIAEERFNGSRDIFRQLKHVLEEQGNIIDSNRFYSLEMREYKKELDNQGWLSEYGQDKIVFLLHETISNYSQTWALPLLWFIIIGISFTLIHIGLGPFTRGEMILPSGRILPWEIIPPIMLIAAYIVGRYSSKKIEMLRDSKPQFYFPGFVLIFLYLFLVNDPLNEFAKTINPLGSLKNGENYMGLEFIWFFHKSIMAFIIYQFIVTLRRQTRRK